MNPSLESTTGENQAEKNLELSTLSNKAAVDDPDSCGILDKLPLIPLRFVLQYALTNHNGMTDLQTRRSLRNSAKVVRCLVDEFPLHVTVSQLSRTRPGDIAAGTNSLHLYHSRCTEATCSFLSRNPASGDNQTSRSVNVHLTPSLLIDMKNDGLTEKGCHRSPMWSAAALNSEPGFKGMHLENFTNLLQDLNIDTMTYHCSTRSSPVIANLESYRRQSFHSRPMSQIRSIACNTLSVSVKRGVKLEVYGLPRTIIVEEAYPSVLYQLMETLQEDEVLKERVWKVIEDGGDETSLWKSDSAEIEEAINTVCSAWWRGLPHVENIMFPDGQMRKRLDV